MFVMLPCTHTYHTLNPPHSHHCGHDTLHPSPLHDLHDNSDHGDVCVFFLVGLSASGLSLGIGPVHLPAKRQ